MDTDNPELTETPSADLLEEFVWLAQQVATFRAALELQVWEKITSGARSAQQIAQENGWDIPGTCRLLDALCSLKLMDKDEQGYQLVPVAKTYLIPGASSYLGDILLADLGWEGNGKLADAIRTGRRPIVSDWTSGGMAAVWVSSEAPSRLRPEQAIEGKDEIWHLLDIAAREGLRVLDVACGLASMTLALAKQNPGVSLTLSDWPPVVESALVVAEKLGIRRQVTPLPGDIHSVDFGKDRYDLIWIGDFLHFVGPEQIVKILKKLNRALIPGGVLVVSEIVGVDESRRGDAKALLGALWLFGVSDEGNLRTQSEWIDFLKQANFVDLIPVSKEGDWHIWFKASKP